MLKMKDKCEKCGTHTGLTDMAFICSFECTFCEACANSMACICLNCSGELVRRPLRVKSPIAVAAAQVSKKLFGGK
jgi:hypothetical protein